VTLRSQFYAVNVPSTIWTLDLRKSHIQRLDWPFDRANGANQGA